MRINAKNVTKLFAEGRKLLEDVNDTCDNINYFYERFIKKPTRVNRPVRVPSEEELRESSYRYMHLHSGCGKTKVNRAFKKLVKEIRPDINLDELTKKRYIALQEARRILLKYELSE